jgi:RNA polymerase sigma-70 factor (ECF subfamily)
MRQADLEELHARLERPLYNPAFRWTWNRDDASDLVQEAFVRLWKMRRRVDLRRAEPLLYRILLNLVASRGRSRRIWRWVSLGVLGETAISERGPEQQLVEETRAAEVRDAVEALPEELRKVVLLCECTELTYDQVAGILGISAGTVGSRRNRALRQMRERLGAQEERDGRSTPEPV